MRLYEPCTNAPFAIVVPNGDLFPFYSLIKINMNYVDALYMKRIDYKLKHTHIYKRRRERERQYRAGNQNKKKLN